MGRIYYAPIESITVGTGGNDDIFELGTGATVKARLLGWEINSSAVAAAALELRLLRASTAGSGGAAASENEADPTNSVTAGVTVTVNNTTPGTGGEVLQHFGWEQLGPLGQVYTPEMAPIIGPSSYLVLNLITAPATFECNGWICWEEL